MIDRKFPIVSLPCEAWDMMSRTCKWPHRDSYLVHLLGKVDNASLAEMAIAIISIQFLGMKFSRHVLGSLTHERMQEVCRSSIENGKWQTSVNSRD